MKARSIITVSICLAVLCGARPSFSGEFRVTPIRLEFNKYAKSGVFNVINEGRSGITLQVTASEWTQDQAGKDVYTETSDIVFFPKIVSLEAGEQRVIRAGMKGAQPAREKTYRLFIEEIPEPKKAEGARISIAIRFAPPIFVKPASETVSGSVEAFGLSQGTLTAVVRNTGNVHVTVTSVTLRGVSAAGEEAFSKEIAGWYLLSGASRPYTADIPRDACRKLSTVAVEVKTDTFTLNRKLNVHQEMCSP
jgi:fimbrial chaperone protein